VGISENNLSVTSNEEKIVNAIEKFKRYRVPEAKAKLLSSDKKSFKIEFTGPFCLSCGFFDYFDDFKIFSQEIGLEIEITEIEEKSDGAVVEFIIEE